MIVAVPLQVLSIDYLEIYVGDHGVDEETNMVLRFALTGGLTAGSTGEIDILFESDGVHDLVGNMVSNDISVVVKNLNGASASVIHNMGTATGDGSTFQLAVSALDDLVISWAAGQANDFTVGDVIEIYIGSEDGCEGGSTGEFDSITLGFGSCGKNNLSNPVSDDMVMVELGVLLDKTESLRGRYGLSSHGDSVKFTANNDPYIYLTLNKDVIDLNELNLVDIVSSDELTIKVETNALHGYGLRYRVDNLALSGDPTTYIAPVTSPPGFINISDGTWGINFIPNTGVDGGDVGVLGSAVINTLGSATLETMYSTNDKYAIVVDDSLHLIASSSSLLSETVYTMSVAASSKYDLEVGTYSTRVIFNVYAKF